MDTISVRNKSGQVSHFSVTGPTDPRANVLMQRVARGELVRVDRDATSSTTAPAVTVDVHANVRDEQGNLLKSVHGGGLDPDAVGDALGRPSGSGLEPAQATKDARVAADAVGIMADNAAESGAKLSPTAVYPAVAALPVDELEEPDGRADSDQLTGAALDEALTDAGLSKTGTADEKRARLAEHTSAGPTDDGDNGDDGGDAAQLKGAALDQALDDAGLPKTGTADDKRERLAEHTASQA